MKFYRLIARWRYFQHRWGPIICVPFFLLSIKLEGIKSLYGQTVHDIVFMTVGLLSLALYLHFYRFAIKKADHTLEARITPAVLFCGCLFMVLKHVEIIRTAKNKFLQDLDSDPIFTLQLGLGLMFLVAIRQKFNPVESGNSYIRARTRKRQQVSAAGTAE